MIKNSQNDGGDGGYPLGRDDATTRLERKALKMGWNIADNYKDRKT